MANMPEIHIYPYFFRILRPHGALIKAIYKYSSNFTTFTQVFDPVKKRKVWKADKTYGICIDHGHEYRFHIGQLKGLMEAIANEGMSPSEYKTVYCEVPETPTIDLCIKPTIKLRTQHDLNQEEAYKFIMENTKKKLPTLLAMPTGTGKTLTSLYTAAKLEKRIIVFVLAKYVDKWVSDISKAYDISKNEICKIQGSDAIINATHWSKDEDTLKKHPLPKAFVVSINSYSLWLKKYETNPNSAEMQQYGCVPDDFFSSLGIGTVIFDEVHEHLHAVYRIFCYLNTVNVMSLSATFVSKDPIRSRIQNTMFPLPLQFTEIKMRQYIVYYAAAYQISDYKHSKVRTTEYGSNRYSHIAFERSILHHKTLRKQYLEMIIDLVYREYIRERVKGDKIVVFVSTADMAHAVTQEFKKTWPELDIRTYLEPDPYENVIEADARITTLLSGGTAVDIPNLTVAINTISVDSLASNLQALGRLREIPGKTVKYIQVYSSSIDKQVEYHHNRSELFASRVKQQINTFLRTLNP